MNNKPLISTIHENSLLARMAAFQLGSKCVAITLGTHIYLWNTDRETFLKNTCWVKHELCHIRQFKEYGVLRFLWLYLMESVRKGYYENKFEKEARAEELIPGDINTNLFISC